MADKRLQMPTAAAQVVVKYDLDGQPVENVLYVEKQHQEHDGDTWTSVPFDAGAADVVGARMKSWLQDHWAAIAHALASATEVDVIWNTVVGAGPLAGNVYQDSDYPIDGTNIGEPLPNNVTVAVEMRTAILGRSYHGRTYVVGLNDGQIDATAPNRLKAASLADIPAAYDTLKDNLLSPTDLVFWPRDRFPLQVMSFVHAGTVRTPAVTTQVTSCTVSDPYLDSQRRRLPGHNRHR